MNETRLDLSAALGETLNVTVVLYADAAESQPLDLTGSILVAVLEPYDLGENGPLSLMEGQGLTFNEPRTGRVHLETVISPAVFDVGLGRWYLKRTDPAGVVTYPKSGKFMIGRP